MLLQKEFSIAKHCTFPICMYFRVSWTSSALKCNMLIVTKRLFCYCYTGNIIRLMPWQKSNDNFGTLITNCLPLKFGMSSFRYAAFGESVDFRRTVRCQIRRIDLQTSAISCHYCGRAKKQCHICQKCEHAQFRRTTKNVLIDVLVFT